ncbi:nuclear pore complex protein Nup93 [Strigomonas culicis]|uniref:Nuclear pore protein n=1 Tax=Strigomonas culicis TaxID=28005 RepID=S9UGD2_9TRYP|nr:nuclear pore complex protein Nup93 [Strigomonas culicis]|eukprot:EPY27983.1 nuclear pore complex protein Nup93 [Strigomonas culicis]
MAENLQRAQRDRDARMEEYSRSRSREIFRGLWNAYHLTLADDFGAAPLRSVTGPSTLPLLAAEEGARQTALHRLLTSSTPMAAELNGKIASFAVTVSELPASDWVYHFASYVAENTRQRKDEVEVLWATVDLLLRAYQRKGSGATLLTYVAASRQLMERKALSALFLSQRVEPGRLDALTNTTTERVRQLMLSAGGNQSVWQQMYTAMRIGRYDVAEEIARQTGNQALQAALKNYAQATAEERQRMRPQVDLQSLYAQDPTRTDAYRQAVLFLLLDGHTGEDEKLQARTLYAICTNVTNSVEDILWLRLACVRTTEENTNADSIQALGYTQRILLDDFQSLLTAMQDNVPRIASFLFHAALPSSGLRLMLDHNTACIDGFHLALCFHSSDLLQRSAYAETPIDIARYLRWYCSSVLLNADLRLREVVNAGMTLFQYFHKTDSVSAFVQLCQEERICYRLFGQKGVLGRQLRPAR